MSTRGPVVRALIGLGLVCAAVLAFASSVVLHGAVLVVVVLAAVVAASVGYTAAADNGRAAAVDASWKAAAGTVTAIVLVAGVVVLAGPGVAGLVCGLAVVTGGAAWLLKNWRARHAGKGRPGAASVMTAGERAAGAGAEWLGRRQPPVSLLPTSVLGSEWLQTSSALACRVEPAARQELIRRRQETLDELERRDPAGFARWLAGGAASDSDPAVFVRGDRTTDSDAA